MTAEHLVKRAAEIGQQYDHLDAEPFLRALIEVEFPGRIALGSSFGTESALLLDLVAGVDRHLPVVFLDTGKMFPETLAYRDTLIDRLGLTNVQTFGPTAEELAKRDPAGELWYFDTDACCALRKVEPLHHAMSGFDALISGRKRYHGALRRFIPRVEAVDTQIKIDPIAHWSREQVEAEFAARNLPRHPLEALGYASVGCAPCTTPVGADGDLRAGRWAGQSKTECGIHLSGSIEAAA